MGPHHTIEEVRILVANDHALVRTGLAGPRVARMTVAVLIATLASACVAIESPTPSAPSATSAPTSPTPTPAITPSTAPSIVSSPSALPEPAFSLDLPDGSDARAVTATVASDIGEAGGTLTVTVTSAATDRVDELVLRWSTELNGTLFLAPFAPSDERIRDGGPPLVQPWTKWVVGPGERSEPDGTVSLGWGPLLPGATLTISLVATRAAPGPTAFDLQLLAGNDLLTLDGGAPAELRVEVP